MDVTKIIEGIALLFSVLFIIGISRIIYQVAFQPKGVTSAEFKKLVQKLAKPRLNSLGFIGNAWDFSKTENGLTYCIQFVPNRNGAWIQIELIVVSDLSLVYKGHEIDVSYKKWLAPKNKIRQNWRYQKTEKSNSKIIAEMLQLIESTGLDFFNKVSDFPNSFLNIEPSNFKDLKTWNDFYQVNLSLEKWIWNLVLLQERSGNYPRGLEFIQLGMKQLRGNTEDWVIEFLEEKEKQFNVILLDK